MAQFVTVLCRLPSGVTLELHDMEGLKARAQAEAPAMQPALAQSTRTLNGAKADPRYHPAEGILLGRAGRTQVESDFWDAWLKQNRQSELVTRKLVFAENTPAKADSAMNELASEKTGLEGNSPHDLPGDTSKIQHD